MLRLVEDTLRAMTPHVIPVEPTDGLPPADAADSVRFLEEWMEKGMPEFSTLTTAAFCLFNLYSVFRTGRTFPRLPFDDQVRVTGGVFRLRGPVAFLFKYLLTSPTVNSYFSRVDVQVALGFDIPTLLEEAEKRRVTRGDGASGRAPAAGADADEREAQS